ncbi:MAG: NAD(P)H-dependent oxidoreductase [candidate division NC10 bacterium]|nr:NAD(P)H-dependent oxidoreductase [candidate division NC10 bacterium]
MTHNAGPQLQDDLTPVLRKVEDADAVILGSPIYFGTVSGMTKSFMERLTFPYVTYTDPPQSLFPGKIRTAVIYTMNVSETQMKEYGYGAPQREGAADRLRGLGVALQLRHLSVRGLLEDGRTPLRRREEGQATRGDLPRRLSDGARPGDRPAGQAARPQARAHGGWRAGILLAVHRHVPYKETRCGARHPGCRSRFSELSDCRIA